MPNDTLDEIEARWRIEPLRIYDAAPLTLWSRAKADIDATIEMVRARDRESAWRPIKELPDEHHHGAWVRVWVEAGALYAPDGGAATHYLLFPPAPLAALDTPPAQEQKR